MIIAPIVTPTTHNAHCTTLMTQHTKLPPIQTMLTSIMLAALITTKPTVLLSILLVILSILLVLLSAHRVILSILLVILSAAKDLLPLTSWTNNG